MLNFTNLDAIEFTDGTRKYIRVYYQNEDNSIRESCFDSDNKWFTRGNAVATNARRNSPIAVASWNNGTQIRVYFLDNSNKIRERVGESNSNDVSRATTWKDGGDLTQAVVRQESKLAIARPGKDDTTLRVYYQKEDNSLGEIMFMKAGANRNTWRLSATVFPTAFPGSGLSAVSAKPAGDVRLYYQGNDGQLKEHYKGNAGWGKSDHPPIPLIPKASISALLWYTSQNTQNPEDLRIHVFTVSSNRVAEISYYGSEAGWDSNLTYLNPAYTSGANYSTVAASRIAGNTNDAADFFYQSDSKVIEINTVTGDPRVARAVVSKGLPTSL
ncbi:MAG: hypothetical protein M1839_005692 [Geoglossum umbratile]|nr:MAG: hypothetical protein M1839_005692 [Geoglossum umbratile]